MVICLVALPILLILSIFSATHRKLAKEAIQCAFKKITFKPCDLSLEQKLKKGVFGALLKKNEKLAFFTFKHFEKLSVIFGIIMILSLAGTAFGVYNFIAFGNCNGPATNAFCVFNPETYSSGIELFGFRFFETVHSPSEVKPIIVGQANSIGDSNAKNRVIEVGCFTCPYTRAAEQRVKELLAKHGDSIYFTFMYFPLPNHSYSFEAAESAECAKEQGKFWEYKKILFEQQSECTSSPDVLVIKQHFFAIAAQIGLNEEQFRQCVETAKYKDFVEAHKQHAIEAGIYGTPTFYVNGNVVVAPTTLEEFEQFLN